MASSSLVGEKQHQTPLNGHSGDGVLHIYSLALYLMKEVADLSMFVSSCGR